MQKPELFSANKKHKTYLGLCYSNCSPNPEERSWCKNVNKEKIFCSVKLEKSEMLKEKKSEPCKRIEEIVGKLTVLPFNNSRLKNID